MLVHRSMLGNHHASQTSELWLGITSIVGFWTFYMLTVLLRGAFSPEPAEAIGYRSINACVGLILTGFLFAGIRFFARHDGVWRMAGVAAAISLPAAILLSAVSLRMFYGPYLTLPYEFGVEIWADLPRLIAEATVTWYFLLAAWCAFFIAMTQQHRARLTELRLAEAEAAAHAAQVRALRYQVNPHFLFNTLNSLSSLVMSGRSDRAENMLMALSTFFRTSLLMDPSADVSLAEEIAFQRLYLDIEKVRFPDRLEVEIDVPEQLEQARVPALILQPLIENAIKYGVSQTTARVKLSIRARFLDGGRMQLDVINKAVGGTTKKVGPIPTHTGTGVGLANVCQRLEAHFGNRADCRFGPIEGGYEVSLAMPQLHTKVISLAHARSAREARSTKV